MSQNLPKRSLQDFLSLHLPNHLLLEGTNNRNVIITYRFLTAPVQANQDFFRHTWLYISTVSIYAWVTMSASSGFRLLGKIPAGAIPQIIMIIYHTLWLLRFTLNNNYYYFFKIFPQFWLAKSTRMHNSP